MKTIWVMMFLYVLCISVLVVGVSIGVQKCSEEVEREGLKNMIEEIWEGNQTGEVRP